jgi:hypothetical protein
MSGDIKILPATEADLPSIKSLLQELMDSIEDTESFDVAQSYRKLPLTAQRSG